MSESGIVVLGAGGHAKVVLATAAAQDRTVQGLFDDDASLRGATVLGVQVVGPIAAANEDAPAVLAIGDNATRASLSESLPHEWATLVHPAAVVHWSTAIGHGSVVFAGAVVQPDVTIGEHVIVNTGATIDHDCRIGRCAHIAPGACLGGGVSIGEGTLVGLGARVMPGVVVGDGVTIGAGAVVVGDVPFGSTVAGVPAAESW